MLKLKRSLEIINVEFLSEIKKKYYLDTLQKFQKQKPEV
jgi:hypothetical protein